MSIVDRHPFRQSRHSVRFLVPEKESWQTVAALRPPLIGLLISELKIVTFCCASVTVTLFGSRASQTPHTMRSLSKLVTPLPGHSLLRHVWPLIRFLNFGLMERIRFFAFRLWLSSDLILSFGLPNFKSNSNFSHPLSVAGDSPAAINSPQKKNV